MMAKGGGLSSPIPRAPWVNRVRALEPASAVGAAGDVRLAARSSALDLGLSAAERAGEGSGDCLNGLRRSRPRDDGRPPEIAQNIVRMEVADFEGRESAPVLMEDPQPLRAPEPDYLDEDPSPAPAAVSSSQLVPGPQPAGLPRGRTPGLLHRGHPFVGHGSPPESASQLSVTLNPTAPRRASRAGRISSLDPLASSSVWWIATHRPR